MDSIVLILQANKFGYKYCLIYKKSDSIRHQSSVVCLGKSLPVIFYLLIFLNYSRGSFLPTVADSIITDVRNFLNNRSQVAYFADMLFNN